MVKTKLVDALIRDAAELLRELDRREFPVDSMFWLHLSEGDFWRLAISSPLVSGQGNAAAYRRLNDVLRSIAVAGITLEDISLLDRASPKFQEFFSLAGGSSKLASGPAWVEFEEAIVYRWTGASVAGELDCEITSEILHQVWESYRKRVNEPALLIDSEKCRFTLRFHPQHGELKGIENVKQAFQLALHGTEKYRNCQVRWVDQPPALAS